MKCAYVKHLGVLAKEINGTHFLLIFLFLDSFLKYLCDTIPTPKKSQVKSCLAFFPFTRTPRSNFGIFKVNFASSWLEIHNVCIYQGGKCKIYKVIGIHIS